MGNKINRLMLNDYKFCIALYLLAIICWLITIATTYVTNINPNDFLGLISKLPIYFYISILLTIIAIKIAYDQRHIKTLGIGSFVLLIILFLTYPLIEPNASFSVTYYPSGMAKQILEKGYMSDEFSFRGYVYLYYPSFQIFTSIFLALTNLNIDVVIKYFHIMLIFGIVVFITLIYKAFSQNWKFAITGSMFFIVFLWSEQLYFGPQLFGFLLMNILYYLLIKYNYEGNTSIISTALLLFICINSTHLLSSFIFILFLFVIYLSTLISKNKTKLKSFFKPFFIIFITWLIYIASWFFKWSAKQLFNSLSSSDAYIQDVTLNRTFDWETLNKAIVFNIRIFFIITNFVLAILAIHFFLKNNRNKYYHPAILWIFSVFLLLITAYGGEIILRVYLYSLIGTIFFITYLFTKINRSTIIFSVLFVLAILNPIAFAGDKAFKLISNSEMSGDLFFVKVSSNDTKVFYTSGEYILKYLDPPSSRNTMGFWSPPNISTFNLTNKYDYIIRSELGTNGLYYYLGYDPLLMNIEEINQNYYKIYDNKKFYAYKFKKIQKAI